MDFDPTAFEDADEGGEGGGDFQGFERSEWDAFAQGEGEDKDDVRPTRDAAIFAIDCSQSLFKKVTVTEETRDGPRTVTKTHWAEVMGAVSDFMKSKIISNEQDRVGVILFNVGEEKNPQHFPGIYTLLELDLPDAQRIKQVEEEALRSEDDFFNRYGRPSTDAGEAPQLSDLFWVAHTIFAGQAGKQHYGSRVMLFTANDNPCPTREARDIAITKAKDLQDLANIELFPLEAEGAPFDVGRFYSDCVMVEGDEAGDYVEIARVRMGEIRRRLRQREFKQRVRARLELELAEGVSVALGLYSSVQPARVPYPMKLNASDNKPLKSQTKWICEETGNILDRKTQLDIFYELGSRGNKVPFTAEEVAQIKYFDAPGLKLIGFKPVARIKAQHSIDHSRFLYPNDRAVRGSGQLCASLIDSMDRKGQAAIVRVIARRNEQPRFCALLAQREVVEEDGMQSQPAGFHVVSLPFADDVRHLELPWSKVDQEGGEGDAAASDAQREQVALATKVIKGLKIPAFHPSMIDNPALQRHYAGIEALALGEEQPEATEDLLLPDTKAMDRHKPKLEAWRAAVYGDEEYPAAAGAKPATKRKAAAAGVDGEAAGRAPRAAKADAGEVDDDEMKRRAGDEKAINKMTVDQLKAWLKTKKLPVGGKKADLVERVKDFFGV